MAHSNPNIRSCLSATKSKVKPNKFCSQTFEREKDAPEKSLQIKNDDLSTCFNCLNIRGILRQQINFASYFGLELGSMFLKMHFESLFSLLESETSTNWSNCCLSNSTRQSMSVMWLGTALKHPLAQFFYLESP